MKREVFQKFLIISICSSFSNHIVISPYAHTTQVTCKNGTHYPIRIQTTSRIHIDPGCTLKLFNHTLRSDESLRLKPEPLLWTWAFNPLTLPSETMAQAKHLDDHLNQIRTHIAALQNEIFGVYSEKVKIIF